MEDFYNYINNYHSAKKNGAQSKETIKNKYSYLKFFFCSLKEHGYIPSHHFNYSRNMVLDKYAETPNKKSSNYLDNKNFLSILKYYYNSKNKYINIFIFLLCAYYGLERSEVLSITWGDINLSKFEMSIKSRKYKLNNLALLCLDKMQKHLHPHKIKKETYIIGNSSQPVNACKINDILNEIGNISIEWKGFCPKYVKKCLAERMFSNGFSLEEIIYYLNINVKSVGNYIQEETIISEGMNRFNSPAKKPKHPFEQTCEEFYLTIKDD